jgi:2-pyrone-4,6-dicarboxylate lactonase
MQFEKTPGWLDWYTGPSQPKFKVPAGAVDAHCHVFGPGAEFPYAPERKYTPCDASKHQLYALRDHLGFARNVVVQATCHGADNRAMVDALVNSGGKARGVATVKRSVTDEEIQAMHDAGVRGVRFNFVKRLVDFTPKDELMEIASRIAKWGWHVVIYFEAVDLPELWDALMCRCRWTARSLRCSKSSCASIKTCGAKCLAPSVCLSLAPRHSTASKTLIRT